jgi:hypothetical protein
MNDTWDIEKELDAMLPNNCATKYTKPFITKPKKTITYNKISEGNGNVYTVYEDDLTPAQERSLSYDHMLVIIQIFIELRNALGYSSIKPHKFDMMNLVNGINTFQVEYSKKYGILFTYGFKIIKADPLFLDKNKRTLNELIQERKHEFAECKLPKIPTDEDVKKNKEQIEKIKNDPFLNKRFGISHNQKTPTSKPLHNNTPIFSYNPLPQRAKRYMSHMDVDGFCCVNNPKIYGNQQVRRRNNKRKQTIINEPPF